jgi:mycothiol synthase
VSPYRLTREARAWRVDLADWTDPAVLDPMWDEVASRGGGAVQLWRVDPTPDSDALAAAAGFGAHRDLLQLRRPLPVPVSAAPALAVRSFVVGQDETAWLAVNNRAFPWHPEQSDWDLPTLTAREAESWFDPAGFLLHEEGDRLAGFCWTKIHPGGIGEIYVIAVDPDFAGRGLGRGLTVAGLDYLTVHGQTVGMLYVEGTNTAGRALYDHLGFSLYELQRAYLQTVTPR